MKPYESTKRGDSSIPIKKRDQKEEPPSLISKRNPNDFDSVSDLENEYLREMKGIGKDD